MQKEAGRLHEVLGEWVWTECILLYGPEFICVLTNRHLSSGLSSERYNHCAEWEEWGLIRPKQPIYFSGLRGRLFHIRTAAAQNPDICGYLSSSICTFSCHVHVCKPSGCIYFNLPHDSCMHHLKLLYFYTHTKIPFFIGYLDAVLVLDSKLCRCFHKP